MTEKLEFSIVILCYRSGAGIIDFVKKTESLVRSLTNSYELVLVGNYIEGSGDRTRDYILKLADSNPKCLALCKPKEGMMGWDMRLGMDAASGKYICVIDGDGQFPIESISTCFKEIQKGECDLVKTYRTKRGDGFYRRLVSKVYNLVFAVLFPGTGTKDANSKPKVLRASAYQKMELKSDDWFVDAEIMLNIRDLGMKFCELPIEFYQLEGRSSFVKPAAILEFVKNLYDYRVRK